MGNNEKKNVQGQVNTEETAQTTENTAQSTNAQDAQTSQQANQPKEGFLKKLKKGADKALNHEFKFTPKGALIGIGVTIGAIIGVKAIYEKGHKDGESNANFENQLTGGEEPLMLETTSNNEYDAQTANDDVVDVEEYTEEPEYEEAEEYVEE